jgi:hypothetical protein
LPVVYDAARGAMVLCHAGSHEIWAYAPRDLTLSPSLVSVRTGGHVTLSLDAGASDAGKGYWLAGCMDAPAPKGLRLGNVTLQLHPDPYFWLTARYPNPVIVNSVGVLDAAGKATATLRVPRLPTGFIGMRFLHAYVVFRSRIERASPPVPLTLVK